MEEHYAGFDESAALAAQRNILRVYRVLWDGGRVALAALDAGTLLAGAVALDEERRPQPGFALEAVDVLCEDSAKEAFLGEELKEEVAGSGVVLVVGVEHLLGKDPERNWVVFEVKVVEDAGWIAKIGNWVFGEIAV